MSSFSFCCLCILLCFHPTAASRSPSLIIQGQSASSINHTSPSLAAQATIIAGESVPYNTFQYTVSLRRDESSATFCGGTLIADEYVLTAAHCALERNIQYVVIGDVSNRAVVDTPARRVFGVRDVWVHPQYEEAFLNLLLYDAAIIRLNRPVRDVPVLALYLGEVGSQDTDDDDVAGQIALISGWGCTDIPTDNSGACPGRVPQTLQYTSTEIVTNEACIKTILGADPTLPPTLVKLGPSVMCTQSFNNQSTCFGDSGGPLVVKTMDNVEGVLVGITSWGFQCGSNDLPFGFGRVSAFREFIDAHVTGQSWTSSLMGDVPDSAPRELEANSGFLVLTVAFCIQLLL